MLLHKITAQVSVLNKNIVKCISQREFFTERCVLKPEGIK
jgi:hypothetical protein